MSIRSTRFRLLLAFSFLAAADSQLEIYRVRPGAYGCQSAEILFEPSPCYAWNNTFNGAKLNLVLRHWADPENNAKQVAHVKEGRDFFNEAPKPQSYTPYTYPHPLQAGQEATSGF